MNLLSELHGEHDLKLNLKFEIEVREMSKLFLVEEVLLTLFPGFFIRHFSAR